MEPIKYSEYLSREIDKSIEYTEYITENVSKSLEYSEYIAEQVNRSFNYSEYITDVDTEKIERERIIENREKIIDELLDE
jgi:hypothetical protein